MNDFAQALDTAASLIAHFDAELREIVSLSLGVSLTASLCAFAIGAPLGTALAVYRFRGKGALIVIANALLGLPPVVVGLAQSCRAANQTARQLMTQSGHPRAKLTLAGATHRTRLQMRAGPSLKASNLQAAADRPDALWRLSPS